VEMPFITLAVAVELVVRLRGKPWLAVLAVAELVYRMVQLALL